MKKLKVAIIGLGRISGRHLNVFKKNQLARLVAICDINKERLDEVSNLYGAKGYTDYKELIDTEDLDVVHVCLPHYLHVPVSKYAIERGVNVITEKPMAINYESALEMVKFAEEKGVLLGVVMQNRYSGSTKFVKNVVESGKLGKIISARSIVTWSRSDEYYSRNDWNGILDKEGGGVLINQAIHTLDIANYIINCEYESLSASMANRNHKGIEVEDTFEGLITYKNGTKHIFYFTNNYGCNEPIEIKLFCENGKVTFDYERAKIVYNDGTVEEFEESEHFAKIDGKDYWGYQHVTQISQFYRACLGEEELEISGREALKTHKLVCDLYDEGRKQK
ncbi:MAG: Gfo/Idh/MocA family oxidoreductase [Clostridia bacterium]|nr:Gfo/Idh/MocA family oxidoreductase [Clostridia bacterium]